MSILVVGTSHRSAPVDVLERLAIDADGAAKVRRAVLDGPHATEALVLSTCNRIELYAEVDRFHGSVEDLTALLAELAGLPVDDLLPSLYVHYDEAAVAHLFEVASGLDSMVVGESQILGQVRESLRLAQDDSSAGPSVNSLFQQGLRVGKRAHAETGIDRAGQSIVSVALDDAAAVVGPLSGARVCVIGAGSIAALAASSVRRRGVTDLVIASRTPAHAETLAARVEASAVPMADMGAAIAAADVVISCTASPTSLIDVELVRSALVGRPAHMPLVFVDLALPRDVEPAVAQLPGVAIIALEALAASVHNDSSVEDVAAVRAIVTEEVVAFTSAREAARVAPTVVALRSMATSVVAAELERLWGRSADLTPEQRAEIVQTVRRVADKLLHEPTVRVKQLVGRSPEASYADALAELFALDPSAVAALTQPGEGS